jgi:hypothetical protein
LCAPLARTTDGVSRFFRYTGQVQEEMASTTEPASHTVACLRRLDEKFDQLHGEMGERFDRVDGRLGRIEDELLVLNGVVLRLEGREVETAGLKAILDRHERGLADLGRRLTELEGANKK